MTLSKDSVQIATVIKKDVKALLQRYAEAHHWSMSQAAALLISAGLEKWANDQGDSAKGKQINDS